MISPPPTRPKCRRCGKPLVLTPAFDGTDDYEMTCSGGWVPGFQSDAAFFQAWSELPGDWVVKLEKEFPEMQQ